MCIRDSVSIESIIFSRLCSGGNKAKAKLEWGEVKYEKLSVTIDCERKVSAGRRIDYLA